MKYDYIIAGMGCAGLSLAMRMADHSFFSNKKILLADREPKTKNDRTWCFWEKDAGYFEGIVAKQWKQLWFHSGKASRLLDITPYTYKLIRGEDFYRHCLEVLNSLPNFQIVYGDITGVESNNEKASLKINGKTEEADFIFSSIIPSKDPSEKTIDLLQHFTGWVIETEENEFNEMQATLMDFRTSQAHGACFVYVMPFSSRKALVEYTLFSSSLLSDELYAEGLATYISTHLTQKPYRVSEKEFGIIPMTTRKFKPNNGHVIFIGTAGGMTKASSGYTFRFIQKQVEKITELLSAGKSPVTRENKMRFHFYDRTFLNVLESRSVPTDKIFSDLFTRNKPSHILRFLDNESNAAEELKILSSLPTMPFLRAALK